MRQRQHHGAPGKDWVALTLAIGIATALNFITIAVFIAAFHRGRTTGDYSLSENATQVLIAAFGGLIGALGGYMGGSAVERARQAERDAPERPARSPETGAAAPGPLRGPGTESETESES